MTITHQPRLQVWYFTRGSHLLIKRFIDEYSGKVMGVFPKLRWTLWVDGEEYAAG